MKHFVLSIHADFLHILYKDSNRDVGKLPLTEWQVPCVGNHIFFRNVFVQNVGIYIFSKYLWLNYEKFVSWCESFQLMNTEFYGKRGGLLGSSET